MVTDNINWRRNVDMEADVATKVCTDIDIDFFVNELKKFKQIEDKRMKELKKWAKRNRLQLKNKNI